jgi:DNA adenine methylase
MNAEANPLKPYLKWAGGKRQLLPEILKRLPGDIKRRTYYDPFVGAGALFFCLGPEKALINDRNAQLIITYTVIKNDVEGLLKVLNGYQKTIDKNRYYEIRDLDRNAAEFAELPDTEKAGRLIYLNKTCYNGLYRVNSRGFFNVPRGRHKNPRIYDETLLRAISVYLNANDITITAGDFESALSNADDRSFIYFDPPYHHPDKTRFTGYQAGGFNEAEQERLGNVFVKMTGRGAKCLLSNADTGFIRELYKGFEITRVKAKRAVNSDSRGRGPVHEVLIKNYPAG